ncbi:SDR family NAD(P)-dependent oxidoreductase [Actinomadura viridis]|uniref:3-oxoacyl-[acyl-carrier protein] reductase n=1 Tax=Actinomadura viridis TaxID=58110 RepID=A0A931GK35_9ACTN|nr:SDR family NAD(P)-dependent oxidoreductase [Actinomadura viridis]MBG6085986.1 3-oxoacyl-[acyl-carrier protein] reductase [Actinomadura viridis]
MSTDPTGPRAAALAGRVAIVTGAGRGIGRGYALRLARLGAAVAVVDRDLHSYAEFDAERELMTGAGTAAEIEEMGGRVLAVEADLGDEHSARRMVERVMDAWGRIDVCVCNAGGGTGALTENTASRLDLDQLATVHARNLLTTVNTCTPVAEVMRAQRSGKIVTVSSVSGLQPRPDGGYAHYAAAKAAVIMYTRCLAQELGPEGVTANVIAPGAIGTGRLLPKMRELGLDEVTRDVALRRLGTVEDCAGVLEFLATGLSDYVTGQVIRVDGGLLP